MTEAAGRELPMASKGSWLEVGGICLLFIAISILGIVWDIASGLITSGIDGIMLAAICLMTAGIFALMLVVVLHSAGMLPKFGKESGKAKTETASAPAKSAAPAAAAPVAAKPAVAAPVAPTSPSPAASAPVPKAAATPPTGQGK
jgi:bacteriorhodopsin